MIEEYQDRTKKIVLKKRRIRRKIDRAEKLHFNVHTDRKRQNAEKKNWTQVLV